MNIKSIAKSNEASGLNGSADIQTACQYGGLIGDNTDGFSSHASKTDDHIRSEQALDLKETMIIDNSIDDFFHVIRLFGIVWNDGIEIRSCSICRIAILFGRRLFHIV